MKESQLQTKIKKRLESHGYFVTKLIQTSTNGIPDIMAIKNGNTIFLEVKREDGKASELQLYMIERLRKFGVFAAIVNDISDIDVFCGKQ